MSIIDNTPEYSRDDFTASTKPYESIVAIKDPFQKRQEINRMAEIARSLHVVGFMKLLEEYERSLRSTRSDIYVDNITSFSGAPLELNAGDWDVSESGILRHTSFGDDVACVHPIMPIERYVNVDTGVEKLKIWWRKGKTYRTAVFDRRVLATASAIVQLADCGIAVNSESAKTLVRWLHDAENLNYDLIPEKQSVGRLGWIEGGIDEPWRFSPYSGTLEFDGNENCRNFFKSVSARGSMKNWLDMARYIRTTSVTARIILAASFASALVRPLGALPFIVHLWGADSGTGKTVGLLVAASVWANPEMGKFIHTWNGTPVGAELSAAFVNSLPLILDELQLVAKRRDFDEDVFKLTEGVGKIRGNKTLGINNVPTWDNCTLSTGNMPITTAQSGSGVINRIIEVECKDTLFPNAPKIAAFVKRNYGFAGRVFIEKLQKDGFDRANELYASASGELAKSDTTEKQAMAAAIILVGDILATEYLFKDEKALTVADLTEFLATKAAVDVNGRGYQYMCEWVALNAHKLTKNSVDGRECWGDISSGVAYIIPSRFEEVCNSAGFNSAALLSWCKQKGLIRLNKTNLKYPWWVNKLLTPCVALILPKCEAGGPQEGFEEIPPEEQAEIPF